MGRALVPTANLLFGLLGSVAAAGLFTIADAQGIEHATHDFIANTGKVADTAAADEHNRVFLQVVAFARNVRGHFLAIGQPYAGHLPQGRVRLLGSDRFYKQAHASLLRTALEHGSFGLRVLHPARLSDKLIDRWHSLALRGRYGPPRKSLRGAESEIYRCPPRPSREPKRL